MRFPLLIAALALSQSALAYDAAPWRADLIQMRQAIDRDYANLDWLTGERGFDLDQAFADTAAHLDRASSDEQARAAFDRLVRRIGDGHVDLRWRSTAAPAPKPAATDRCAELGYSATMINPAIADRLPDYRALAGGGVFPGGVATVAGTRLGVLRIGLFEPNGYPDLCRAALAKTPTADGDVVIDASYTRMTADLAARLAQMRTAGAQALLVDLSGNGGGSEWAEVAARMVTGRTLRSARVAVMPSDAWRASRLALAKTLRQAASTTPAYRARLLEQAEITETGARPCVLACPRLVANGYTTGVFDDPPAAPKLPTEIDSIGRFGAARGLWRGPLIVLVDDETWSAAEEFAASLQDNDAAIVVGTRSGGAGCGHATDRPATKLTNSGATLSLPDCIRYRRDGSNEVRGIIPDVPMAIRQNDAPTFKARLLEAALPQAIDLARKQGRAR